MGAWIGAHASGAASPRTFQRIVPGLLPVSGVILLAQAVTVLDLGALFSHPRRR